MLRVLEVSRLLAGPFELVDMLHQVIDAGRQALTADRGTLFLYDQQSQELYTFVASGIEGIRFGVDKGIAGECARKRQTINVHDCYADPRFNPDVDRQTGYRTRCLIAVPLVGLNDELVGVLQLLNPERGAYTPTDERIAEALASHAASAIQRVKLMQDRIAKEKLQHSLNLAREVQRRVLPSILPKIPGYDLAAFSRPAEETCGDIYDLAALPLRDPPPTHVSTAAVEYMPEGLVILLADAVGHGITAALPVLQVRAMVRMGLRMHANLDDLLVQTNKQLIEDLDVGRFVTAFIGVLDPRRHVVDYHAAGQGPILHFRADSNRCEFHPGSTFPLGLAESERPPRPAPIMMDPGDWLILLTDGFYEYQNPRGEQMGRQRIEEIVRSNLRIGATQMLETLIEQTVLFASGRAQLDDLTAVIIKRTA